uniref:Uncharacterized protein n=1 Tax=viral metagenome TaxID=1070528 RepID=A0A6M3XZS3_9ZZZZ
MKIKTREVAYHRNGIGGDGFHVVRFTTTDDADTRGRDMLAVLFDGPGEVAVLDIGLLADGVIAFAQNSWRGADYYGPALRRAIKDLEA